MSMAQIDHSGSTANYHPLSLDVAALGNTISMANSIGITSHSNAVGNANNGTLDENIGINQQQIPTYSSISAATAPPPIQALPASVSSNAFRFPNSPLPTPLGTLPVASNCQPIQQQGLLPPNTSLTHQIRPYNMMFGVPGINEPRILYDEHMALPPLPHNGSGSWLRIRQPIDLVTPLKKPMNSFLLYSAERRVQLRQTHPDLNTTQQSTILAREWANLPEEEKEKYRAEAKQLRDDYNARRAELSLKLQQQLNQQHLNLGLPHPPPPPSHCPAPQHQQSLDLLDSASGRDPLARAHHTGSLGLQQQFPGSAVQIGQTQFSPIDTSSARAQQASTELFPQIASNNNMADPFRFESSFQTLNSVATATATGLLAGSAPPGEENTNQFHAYNTNSSTPKPQDLDVQLGIMGGEQDKRGINAWQDFDTFGQDSLSAPNATQYIRSSDVQQKFHHYRQQQQPPPPQSYRSLQQEYKESDQAQLNTDIFDTANGLFNSAFDNVIKPSGTDTTLGVFSGPEFNGIGSAGSYTGFAGLVPSLPPISDSSTTEYKYEQRSTSDEKGDIGGGTNMTRIPSFGYEQAPPSIPGSNITAATATSDYDIHEASTIGNSGGSNSTAAHTGTSSKSRARLSSPVKRARKKSKKDPDAPKHPMSAFLYYLTSERPRLADQLGDMSIGQQTKIIAKRWKTLDETDKAPWERLAKHDKDRYARERREYHGEAQQSSTPAAPN
ncbi:High mobility group [Coemansia spiralis]|uniref:High mobility group n=1 Tax=Coemansia spiralis TaxID=417178 RepID=A0A9W8G4P4_9FUNG|nr:High mobility group [Coemansia spiralis]